MRRIALAALLLSATLANGQWLGEKLSLLDEFGIPAGHQSLAYSNHNHTVYLSGDESDSIVVIDADRCKSIARVGVGRPVGAMCYNPAENKLYCAYADADTVVVLNGTTNQVLALVPVGDTAGTFCYDSLDNKMYVGNWGSRSVTVIDCRIDAVVATVESCGGSWRAPYGMCFVAAHQSVYVTKRSDSSVVAIDCSSDSVLARIPVGEAPCAVCYNPTNDRVYCMGWDEFVYGIDAASNQVVSTIPRGHGYMLACDPVRNVLFAPSHDDLVVVDCATDTVVKAVDLPWEESEAQFAAYDPRDNKIYVAQTGGSCGGPGAITVVDGETYQVRELYVGRSSVASVCVTEARGRLFVAGGHDEGALAVDGVADWPRGVWVDRWPAGLFAGLTPGKLYGLSNNPCRVIVFDPVTGILLATIPLTCGDGAVAVTAYNTREPKVYVALDWYYSDKGRILVLDAEGDTVITEIDVVSPRVALAYDPDDDLLYAAGGYGHQVLAIDGKTDSVVDSCWISQTPGELLYNGAQRRLYCFGGGGEVTATTPRQQGHDRRIQVGAKLEHFALNSSGTRLYGASWRQDSVYVIDCVGESLTGAIPVGEHPEALCYDSHHDRLYCGSEDDGIFIIDCGNDAVAGSIPVSSNLLYYDSATDIVYSVGRDSIVVIEGQTCRVVWSSRTGSDPMAIASASGWPCVYTTFYEKPGISVIHKASAWVEMGVKAVGEGQATVAKATLDWTGTLAVMYDKSGRRVADVHRGANDVSRLQPGVYFVRQNGVRRGTYARKVVVTR